MDAQEKKRRREQMEYMTDRHGHGPKCPVVTVIRVSVDVSNPCQCPIALFGFGKTPIGNRIVDRVPGISAYETDRVS